MMSHVPAIVKGRLAHRAFVVGQIDARVANQTERKDFFTYMLRHKADNAPGGKGMTHSELYDTGNVLVVAGSETSATVLSGTVWLLLRNPHVLAKLNNEIRTAFKHTDDINFISSNSRALPYLNAVIDEAMRCFPAIPGLQPRRTVVDTVIDGKVVPPGTLVGVSPWAAYHSADNFHDPDAFVPERWLAGSGKVDVLDAVQPFSVGPRSCLGKR